MKGLPCGSATASSSTNPWARSGTSSHAQRVLTANEAPAPAGASALRTPGAATRLHLVAEYTHQQNLPDPAIDHYEKALKLGLTTKEVYAKLGTAYQAIDKYEEALIYFNKSVAFVFIFN